MDPLDHSSTRMHLRRNPAESAVLDALLHGATVVTGNARAARRFERVYGQHQQASGHKAWASPAIFDWRSWMNHLWQQWSFEAEAAPLLLSALQEAELWRQMLGSDAARVVAADSLASLAQDAYALLSAYDAHPNRKDTWQEPDAEHFRHWAARFDEHCQQHQWLSPSLVEATLTQAVFRGEIKLPAEVCLVGFDRMVPAQKNLCEQMRAAGVSISEPTTLASDMEETSSAPRPVFSFAEAPEERSEMVACAQWISEQLAANPQAQLAVLATNIKERRNQIDRVFRSVLSRSILSRSTLARSTHSHSAVADSSLVGAILLATEDSHADPLQDVASVQNTPPLKTEEPEQIYEFTLGHPLAEQPMVHAALLALAWLTAPLEQDDVTWLLLSGFLGRSTQERIAAAELDLWLRRNTMLRPLVALQTLVAPEAPSGLSRRPSLPKGLHQRLGQGFDFARNNHFAEEPRLPGNWCELARRALSALGWTTGLRRSSVQQQTLRHWEQALEEIARLDLFAKPIRYESFLALLKKQTQESLFSPESTGANVQIMGPVEAAGQSFDGLWFLGATDTAWPATGRPHPLLPLGVQRSAAMPHSSKEEDWRIAQRVTERILTQCNDATTLDAQPANRMASYAKHNQDGELRPSGLLLERSAQPPIEIPSAPLTGQSEPLEFFEDSAVALIERHMQGGASLLKDQAQCPFRAFALHRLRAREIEQPAWGLDAQQRGTLLHSVLQNFWQAEEPRRIAGLEDLKKTIAEGSLGEILRFHIQQTFAPLLDLATQLTTDAAWLASYLAIEQQRLQKVLTEWLEHESTRQPFVVEACEQKLKDVPVGPLTLNLQIDRIDALDDGSHLLIDYKTGEVSTSAWNEDHFTEPQLPLYATYGGVADLSGIVFAMIRPGAEEFAGHLRDAKAQLFENLADRDALVKSPYDQDMQEGWKKAIDELAKDFSSGLAEVRPQDGAQSCQYCPLPSLCRIHELRERYPEQFEPKESETKTSESSDSGQDYSKPSLSRAEGSHA